MRLHAGEEVLELRAVGHHVVGDEQAAGRQARDDQLEVGGVARAVGVEEKPSQRFLCNAGIYVLSPGAVRSVPAGMRVDMTGVIDTAIGRGSSVSVFPIHEFWTDIGTPRDLEHALAEFGEKAHS